MTGRRHSVRHRLALLCALAIPLATTLAGSDAAARRGELTKFDRTGFYLGGGYRQDAIGGAMDGQSVLVGSDIVALVPKVETGGGLELSMAALGTYGGLVLTYATGDHDVSWLGATGTARRSDLDFDFRISLLPRSPIQPHGVVGLGFKRLSVKDAAVTRSGVDDAVYRGISWDFGFGASAWVMPRAVIDVSAVHAGRSYNTIASGNDDSTITISDGLDGKGWSLRAELMVKLTTFQSGRPRRSAGR
jgi:hypothetical protein